MGERTLTRCIASVETTDGGGVRIRRSIGASAAHRVDPFLMLDEFGSVNPDDYIAGFPSHPHRGFETVTYMLEGEMLHEDHLGNRGFLSGGGAQWMTAGRGVIHSEMPRQTEGRMRGFQLWVNLPAAEKMQPAWYRDLAPAEIPEQALAAGGTVRTVAGELELDGQPVSGAILGRSTAPIYIDVRLPAAARVRVGLPVAHSALVYPYEGALAIGAQLLAEGHAGVLSAGAFVTLQATDRPLRCLLMAARPLGEPVVQYGPFVMNTAAEIDRAVRDYRNGTLTEQGR